MLAATTPERMLGEIAVLSPLRRDQALAFVIEQIARHGLAPTMGEIARELKISNSRAKELIYQLQQSGAIERVPGSVRGIRVRNVAESRLQLTEVLRRLGWPVADPARELRTAPTYPLMIAIVANVQSTEFEEVAAPLIQPLDYLPQSREGASPPPSC